MSRIRRVWTTLHRVTGRVAYLAEAGALWFGAQNVVVATLIFGGLALLLRFVEEIRTRLPAAR
jgi:hypothetical protein